MRHALRLAGSAATLCLLLTACAPCPSYCQRSCDCSGDSSAACVDRCLENLEVYTEQVRDDHCANLQQQLDDDELCLDGDSP
jgi:hypothetical protein